MQADALEALQSRLVAPIGQSTQVARPPLGVPSLVAVLVPPSAVLASLATYQGGSPTLWTVYAATRVALAYVEVEFDEGHYTAEVERDVPSHYRGGRYAQAKVQIAWVRPLSRISEMVVSCGDVFENTGRWNVAASVRFDGVADPVVLPDQHSMIDDDEQWARADELLRVIRDGIGAPR